MVRRRREIDRHEHAPEDRPDVLDPQWTRVGRRGHQYGLRRFTQHPLGGGTEEQLPDAGETMRADDNEIARVLACDAQDLRSGLSHRDLGTRTSPRAADRARTLSPRTGPARRDCPRGLQATPVPRSNASVRRGSSTVIRMSRAPKCPATAAAYRSAPREASEKSMGQRIDGRTLITPPDWLRPIVANHVLRASGRQAQCCARTRQARSCFSPIAVKNSPGRPPDVERLMGSTRRQAAMEPTSVQ